LLCIDDVGFTVIIHVTMRTHPIRRSHCKINHPASDLLCIHHVDYITITARDIT